MTPFFKTAMGEKSYSQLTVTGLKSGVLQLGLIVVVLYFVSRYNYLLFHSLAEGLSVAIAAAIFFVVWNARKFLDNNYFIVIGIAFLTVGSIDFLHALAYKGVGVFLAGGDANLATQLWLAGRYVTALSFLAAPLLIDRKSSTRTVFAGYVAVLTLLLLTIFYWGIFPAAYVEGIGLTPFKIISEYLTITILIASLVVFYRKRSHFHPRVFRLLTGVVSLLAALGLPFVLYLNVYDFFNFIGHIGKIAAFYLSYLGIVEFGLMHPYRSLFKNLKDNEVKYRELADGITDSFLAMDDETRFVYWNRASEEMFGIPASEAVGKKFLEVFPDMKGKDFHRILDTAMETQKPQYHVGKRKWKNMDQYIEISVYPGDKRISVVARDVTLRKDAENNLKHYAHKLERLTDDLNKFKLAVENASDQVVITDERKKIIYANRAAEEITGYRKKELIGNTPLLWGSLVSGHDQRYGKAFQCVWDVVSDSNPYFKGEVVNQNSRGERFVTDLHISPILDEKNNVLFYVAISRDITQLKEIEKTKDDFISLASHQLRTPLANMSMTTDLLIRGVAGDLNRSQKNYLRDIHKSIYRMAGLISNLLNISRIEMGTFVLQSKPLDVAREAAEIAKEISSQAKEREISFEYCCGENLPWINFDPNAFQLIMENLATNAIRYTGKGGCVSVRMEESEGGVLVTVADSGCGIPEHQQKKVYRKSFRAENAQSMSADGAGLGLYIVKTIAKKTGSRVWFDSPLPQAWRKKFERLLPKKDRAFAGTVFYFYLPSVNKD